MSQTRPLQTPDDVLGRIRDQDIRMVDIRFVDLLGAWQHFTLPAHQLHESRFVKGFVVGGQRMRGFEGASADVVVVPDATTARIDPFLAVPTLVLLADIRSVDGSACLWDPRGVARRAEAHLSRSDWATHVFYDTKIEFFIFDDVRTRSEPHAASYVVDAASADWNSDREEFPNLGYKIRAGKGDLQSPPGDALHDLRTEIVLALEDIGISVARHHHGPAAGGHAQIDLCHTTLLEQADTVAWLKYVVKNIARRAGKTATFMPQPLFGVRGSSMNTGVTLWRDALPLFASDGQGHEDVSATAHQFIGGVLGHLPALCAWTNPATNSYRRLASHPPDPTWVLGGRGAPSSGSPVLVVDPAEHRIHLQTPDPLANPYFAFAAILLAGLDGVAQDMSDGVPASSTPPVPTSLGAALDALEADHDFLVKDGVFEDELVRAWIQRKRNYDANEVYLRPHPHEYVLYFDG